ncbi:MAG: hypothetical protein PWP67_1219 [Clostridium butyricum]|nr:hypothetical protein [Thermoanaerobacterium sp.]MDK2828414.1 hypothetical protein [Clostridium butyricum]
MQRIYKIYNKFIRNVEIVEVYIIGLHVYNAITKAEIYMRIEKLQKGVLKLILHRFDLVRILKSLVL